MIRLKAIFFALLLSALLACTQRSDAPVNSPEVKASLEQFFPDSSATQLKISSLTGGYSQASNLKIENGGPLSYVLRLYRSDSPAQEEVDREFHMMVEASQLGVAPYVHGIANSKRGMLTAFIAEKQLSLEQIKLPAELQRIGEALQLVHAIPKHSHPIISISEKYEAIYGRLPPNKHASDAITLIREWVAKLQTLGDFGKNIHGELHSRNIFITEQKVLFIDWTESTWADPFYDLSYFVLLYDLNKFEEQTLLHGYLGHKPTDSEKERYDLTKKINLAGMSLVLLQQVNRFISANQDIPQSEVLPEQRKNLSYYVQRFSNTEENLSSQFFHDWAMTALEMAQSM